jgi:hypothetical protein
MVQNKDIIDLLFVEESSEIGYLFNEISNIFGLTVKIAKNLDEFVELATIFEFKIVLCNLHIEHNFAGLFLSRVFANIKKIKVNDGKLFFYSFQNNPTLELSKLSINDLSEEVYSNFYDFMLAYFPQQCKHYFQSEELRLGITA